MIHSRHTFTTSRTHNMALVGLLTAIICVISPFAIVFPFSPVPVSLGTLAIYFTVMILGCRKGTISVLIYILLGLVGLPVFSGFSGGVGKLFGPTGGYIIGYIFMALICGFFTDKWHNKFIQCFMGMLLGTIACYAFGTLWLSIQANLSFSAALTVGVLPFLPTDLMKLFVALLGSRQIRKRLMKAGLI